MHFTFCFFLSYFSFYLVDDNLLLREYYYVVSGTLKGIIGASATHCSIVSDHRVLP